MAEQRDAPSRQVQCGRHGPKPAAYVCDHLFRESNQGFVASEEEPGNPFPDAWCLTCEQARLAHGGWNEQSEKNLRVQLVCGECYQEIKARNQ